VALAMLAPSPCVDDVLSALSTVVVRTEGTRTIVVIGGEADISTRPVLSDALSRVIATLLGDVVIDLTETDFIDSAIGRTLADAQRMLDRQGRQVTFRSPSRLAARLLDLFGLTALIETAGAPQRPA
jgi:anti-anti-sigma factor